MVLIIAEKYDYTTIRIAKWLSYFNVEILYTNKPLISKLKITHEDVNFEFEVETDINKMYSYKSFSGIYVKCNFFEFHIKNECQSDFERQIIDYQRREVQNSLVYLDLMIKPKKIGDYFAELYLSKISQIEKAKNVGLKVPEYLITNSKIELLNFKMKHNKIVTKPIDKHFSFFIEKINFNKGLNSILDDTSIEILSDNFNISFFQKYIDKKYEIRTFFVRNKIWSMAIFSQENPKTIYDFRNYDSVFENRYVPFSLPIDVINKIKAFAECLNLTTFSADFVVSETDELIFLEVNPLGQFGWLSYHCNFNIEQEIAKILINGYNE